MLPPYGLVQDTICSVDDHYSQRWWYAKTMNLVHEVNFQSGFSWWLYFFKAFSIDVCTEPYDVILPNLSRTDPSRPTRKCPMKFQGTSPGNLSFKCLNTGCVFSPLTSILEKS
mmetsp:Transcript_1627/g.3071  ORF Transcript_1627/g.3071 Transcript_1627/m.3071 type:complete len:113 (+) Transcript_1627:210-548(+)